jgi:hypothetical protein
LIVRPLVALFKTEARIKPFEHDETSGYFSATSEIVAISVL